VKLRYLRPGEYFEQIPARDLTDDEVAALEPATVDALVKSGVYEVEAPPKPAKADTKGND
jgi:hypothetical protein